MQVISLSDITGTPQPSVVTVGNFDGVHRGHQSLIGEVVDRARQRKARSIVVTFDPHTRAVLSPTQPVALLTTLKEKAAIIGPLGVDHLVYIRFDAETARMAPRIFVEEVLVGRLGAVEWVMGEGHAFGRDRAGESGFLRDEVGGKHFYVSVFGLVAQRDAVISSTEIRTCITSGAVAGAAEALGHPYAIIAKRVRGVGTARKLGFPTFNFERPPAPKVLPPAGVYAARLQFRNARVVGALYFGDCPTFEHRDVHFEFHALENVPVEPGVGEDACLWVYDHLRPDKKFDTHKHLSEQIDKDIRSIRQFFSRER